MTEPCDRTRCTGTMTVEASMGDLDTLARTVWLVCDRDTIHITERVEQTVDARQATLDLGDAHD